MAILTTDEYVERWEDGDEEEFDFDMAQTVASWWYSPAQPALVALATAGKVLPSLEREIELEIEWAEKSTAYTEDDIEDLRSLLKWAQELDEPESEEY
jgi:hypothetical protein